MAQTTLISDETPTNPNDQIILDLYKKLVDQAGPAGADQFLQQQGANVRSADLSASQSPIVQALLGQGMTKGLGPDQFGGASATGLTYSGGVAGYGGPIRPMDKQLGGFESGTATNQAQYDNIRQGQEQRLQPGPGGLKMGELMDKLGAARAMGPAQYSYINSLKIPGINAIDPNQAKIDIQKMKAGGGVPGVPDGVAGPDVLSHLSDSDAALVKKVANYEIPITGRGGMDAKTRTRILPLVALYDPEWNAQAYEARNKMRQDFTSGGVARNRRSINTVISHLEELQNKGEKLGNISMPLVGQTVNTVKNIASQHSGNPEVTNFNNAATAVESELASVFKGANSAATDQEIKAWRANLSPNMSPEQIKGSIDTAVKLMAGRLASIKDQWTEGMKKPADFNVLSEQSRKTLSKMGINPDAVEQPAGQAANANRVKVVGPDGKAYSLPPEQLQDALKQGYKEAK